MFVWITIPARDTDVHRDSGATTTTNTDSTYARVWQGEVETLGMLVDDIWRLIIFGERVVGWPESEYQDIEP